MIRSKLGLKALGLCALVLGLMAISAGAAQAEKGAHWNVNGNAVTEALKAELGATLEGPHGVLLSKALGAKFTILCTEIAFENALLKIEGGSSGLIKFSGCVIFLGTSETPSSACQPHTGAEVGVILTLPLKDLIVLHNETWEKEGKKFEANEPVDELVPAEGETFVTIQTSAECSVGGKAGIPVIGKFTLKDCQHEGRVEKVTHLGEELAALTTLWILSKTAEHVSTIEGSANVSLVGAHKDTEKEKFLWSGTPA